MTKKIVELIAPSPGSCELRWTIPDGTDPEKRVALNFINELKDEAFVISVRLCTGTLDYGSSQFLSGKNSPGSFPTGSTAYVTMSDGAVAISQTLEIKVPEFKKKMVDDSKWWDLYCHQKIQTVRSLVVKIKKQIPNPVQMWQARANNKKQNGQQAKNTEGNTEMKKDKPTEKIQTPVAVLAGKNLEIEFCEGVEGYTVKLVVIGEDSNGTTIATPYLIPPPALTTGKLVVEDILGKFAFDVKTIKQDGKYALLVYATIAKGDRISDACPLDVTPSQLGHTEPAKPTPPAPAPQPAVKLADNTVLNEIDGLIRHYDALVSKMTAKTFKPIMAGWLETLAKRIVELQKEFPDDTRLKAELGAELDDVVKKYAKVSDDYKQALAQKPAPAPAPKPSPAPVPPPAPKPAPVQTQTPPVAKSVVPAKAKTGVGLQNWLKTIDTAVFVVCLILAFVTMVIILGAVWLNKKNNGGASKYPIIPITTPVTVNPETNNVAITPAPKKPAKSELTASVVSGNINISGSSNIVIQVGNNNSNNGRIGSSKGQNAEWPEGFKPSLVKTLKLEDGLCTGDIYETLQPGEYRQYKLAAGYSVIMASSEDESNYDRGINGKCTNGQPYVHDPNMRTQEFRNKSDHPIIIGFRLTRIPTIMPLP